MEYYFSEKIMEDNINKNKITSYSKPFEKKTSESTLQDTNYLLSSSKA